MGVTLPNGLPALTRRGMLVNDDLIDGINRLLGSLAVAVESGSGIDITQTIPGTYVVNIDPEKNQSDDGGSPGGGSITQQDITNILNRLAAIEACFPLVSSVECVDGDLEVTECSP